MLRKRVIPVLLLKGNGLVKTIKFKNPTYIGDPINAVKIFNEKEVDELVVLDITATIENRAPNFSKIAEIANECFMPLGYGGGIKSIDEIKKLFDIGIEKIILNSSLHINPKLITEAANIFGCQSIIASIDIKKNILGNYIIKTHSGTKVNQIKLIEFLKKVEDYGVGEIIINSIDRDGTMEGYDYKLIRITSEIVSIPVVACGGAGKIEHLAKAINDAGASAVAAGSLFVFQGVHKAVLISYPNYSELMEKLN